MYTAGLAPFYASNFSLWSAAYCSAAGPAAGGCFPLEAAKKPSFCIADILHAGGEAAAGPADAAPGLPAAAAAALGSILPGGPFHAAASPLRRRHRAEEGEPRRGDPGATRAAQRRRPPART